MPLASLPPPSLRTSTRPRGFAAALLVATALFASHVVDRPSRDVPARAARARRSGRSGRSGRFGRELDVTVQVASTTIRLRADGAPWAAATTLTRALSMTAAAIAP